MKRNLLLGGLLMISAPVLLAGTPKFSIDSKMDSQVVITKSEPVFNGNHATVATEIVRSPKSATPKANGATYSVVVKLEADYADENMLGPSTLQYYFKTNLQEGEKGVAAFVGADRNNSMVTYVLPEGTYDLLLNFDALDGNHVVILEDVVVDQDLNLTVSSNQADNFIQFKPVLPNGDEITLPYTLGGPYLYDNDCNVSMGTNSMNFIHSDYGLFWTNIIMLIDSPNANLYMMKRGGLYINKNSKVNVASIYTVGSDDGVSSILLLNDGHENQVVANTTDDYKGWLDTKVKPSLNVLGGTDSFGRDLTH